MQIGDWPALAAARGELGLCLLSEGPDWWRHRPLGLGFATDAVCGYLPLLSAEEQISTRSALQEAIKAGTRVFARDAKLLCHFLKLEPGPWLHDLGLLRRLWLHDLGTLKRLANLKQPGLPPPPRVQPHMELLAVAIAATQEAHFILNVGHDLFRVLSNSRTNPVYQWDQRFLALLWRVERHGLRIDRQAISEQLKAGHQAILESWLELADGEVLHTTFSQTVTRTGRLSSARPNLQNVPADLRHFLIPSSGRVFLAVDWHQQELHMLAALSGDSQLRAFLANHDFFARLAELLWGQANANRRRAKELTFAILYGAGLATVASRLGCSEEEARELITGLFKAFPRVHHFLVSARRHLRERGQIYFWSGRPYTAEPKEAYKAANALIQGGCADLLARAALRCQQLIQEYPANLCLLVHDELIFDVEPGALRELVPAILGTMEMRDLFDYAFPAVPRLGPTLGSLELWSSPCLA